ncbi:hypothetical protein I4F81_008596 [Pyropia yezoensis]|uniref:Uncharacterized protein n=1 Tax=Pyropia yezoensis TaxID=2788 RepID=A0ACC3C8K8_PYRYE|nr:hypothetical protein I4F81_008596 [Neopyropia yezoensis]
MGSGGRRVVSRGGRRRSLADTDRPPRVGAPSGGSTGGFWTGGSGSKSSGGGAGRPLPRSHSPTNSARLSVPTSSGEAATAAATASAGAGGGSRGGGDDGDGGVGEAVRSAPPPPREYSSVASGLSTSFSSVIPGVLQSTDIDVYGRGDDAVFGPGAAAATQYEAAAALEATRRRTSVVGAGEHVDRDGWGRGDSIIFGRGASTVAARDAAAAYRRVQRRSARRGYIVPAATLIEGRWRRELRPGRWIGSRLDSAASAVGGSAGRVGGRSTAADATGSSAATTSLRAGVSRSSGNAVPSGGTRTSLDMGGDDLFVSVNASGAYLDRTDESRSLPRGITSSSTGSTLAFPAADEPSVGGVDEPATADLFDSDDMALLATYGRASGSTEEPSTSELLRDETGLEAAAAVAAREAAAARGEEYDEGIDGTHGNGGAAGIASRTAPVVAEGGAYGVRIYLDGGADSDSDSSSGVDPPVGGARREYSPEVEALLFGDDSENDGDVEESAQGRGDAVSRGGTENGSTFQGTTGSGGGPRRRSSAADDDAHDTIDDDVGEDNWPLSDGGEIYAGTTGELETERRQGGAMASVGGTDEWAGDTADIVAGGRLASASGGTSQSSRGAAVTETATVVAAAATSAAAAAAAAAASTASAVGSSPEDWGSEADDAPSSSARFASASTDLSVPGGGVLADGESDADALRAPEEGQNGEVRDDVSSHVAAVPSTGNDDADDDPDGPAVIASPLQDDPATNVWPAVDNSPREAIPPPLDAWTMAREASLPSALAPAAAAAATDPLPVPLAAVVKDPLIETPPRDEDTASEAADKNTPGSSPTGSSLGVELLAANGDASDASPGSIPVAPPADQHPAVTLAGGDGEAGNGPALLPPSRLAAAVAKVGSKTTAGVAAAGSALVAVASVATGRMGDSTTNAHAEAASGDGAPVTDEVGDDFVQFPPPGLAAAAATVRSTATAGVAAASSALATVAGMATGRGGKKTTGVSVEETIDAPGMVGAAAAGEEPAEEATDTSMTFDVDQALEATEPLEGAVPWAAHADVEPGSEAQPATRSAGGFPAAVPADGPTAVDSTATAALDGAADPDSALAAASSIVAVPAPVVAPVAAASRPAEVPASVTPAASALASIHVAAVDEAVAVSGPVAANDGGDMASASPVDSFKAAATVAVLPVSKKILVDRLTEAAEDDYEPADADEASDDDFTAEGPSTGSWAGITAPTFSAVTPASAIPAPAMAAAAGGASAAAVAAATASLAATDPASATEPDEADDYTTAIDGWEDSLVLTRGGGESRASRLVHFGREPASNATSATDDDARYYDARLELP